MSNGGPNSAGLARTRLRGLGQEADLLLALSRVRLTPHEQERVHRFMTANGRSLDWGLFIELACSHGVLPLVGRNLGRYRLTYSDDGRSLAPYRWLYSHVYQGNRLRNMVVRDEYSKVLRAVNDSGLEYAIRKGPVLNESVYADPGMRRMGDLDVLLHREDLDGFAAIVAELGYAQGHLTRTAEKVVPFDRRTQVTWKVALPNSTLPFLKPAHSDDVDVFVLDPCFDLFQPKSGLSADLRAMGGRTVSTTHFGEQSRMLARVDQVIDACVQIHVEATTLMYIEIGKDLTLIKFLDLVQLLRELTRDDVRDLMARVDDVGCHDSVAFAVHHAAQIYDDDVPREVMTGVEEVDPDVFERYGVLDGTPRRWDLGFAERLFTLRRWQLLTTRSTVPGPRAVV